MGETMSKFFVGQRVRVKYMRNPFWSYLSGREATVTGIGPYPELEEYVLGGDYRIRIDGDTHNGDAQVISSQLEPIIDLHQPCESEFKESLDKLLETTHV